MCFQYLVFHFHWTWPSAAHLWKLSSWRRLARERADILLPRARELESISLQLELHGAPVKSSSNPSGCLAALVPFGRVLKLSRKLARESPVIPWKSTIHIANSCSSSNGGSNDAHSRVTKLHVNNIWLHVCNDSAYQAEQKSLTTFLPVCPIYFKVLYVL
jgi:hypothetical protein